MRKVIFFFVLLIPAVLFAFQNEPDGFRDIKCGQGIESLKNIVLTLDISDGKPVGDKFYKRKNDVLKLGEAQLESLRYVFWNDKFSGILITAKGYTNWRALKDVVFEKFGEGEKPNRFIEKYSWIGDKGGVDLKYNEISKEANLMILCIDVLHEKKDYEILKAKEGAAKGF